MTRYSKTDVEDAVSGLAQLIGAPLKLEMWTPGDKHGTRYRIYALGDTPGSQGRQLLAECGAKATVERLWTASAILGYYLETHKVGDATVQLQDLEA